MLHLGRNPDNTQKETISIILTEEETHDIVRCLQACAMLTMKVNDTDPVAFRYDKLAVDLRNILIHNT